jgi:phosphonate transport system substrate-binding protein
MLDSMPARRVIALATLAAAVTVVATACGDERDDAAPETLTLSAIPDQDPEQLARLYGALVDHLSEELDIDIEYVPVTDYAAAVSLFRAGDLDAVWFGGLTGVQARLQTPGAVVVAQRDIDADFHSVFIANEDAGISPIDSTEDLDALAGTRFTFGSESSTSGRLMPQFFLSQAGVEPDGFDGEPGFSGSHDATIDLVEAGTYEAGALNEQVWQRRVDEGKVDTDRVRVIFRSPAYHDYHWLVGPEAVESFGDDFPERFAEALFALSADDPADAAILELFGATSFIPADVDDYASIESVGRDLGLITE